MPYINGAALTVGREHWLVCPQCEQVTATWPCDCPEARCGAPDSCQWPDFGTGSRKSPDGTAVVEVLTATDYEWCRPCRRRDGGE